MKDRVNLEKEVIHVGPEDTLANVLGAFKFFNISHVPVVKEEKLVGIISKSDVTNHLIDFDFKNETVVYMMNQIQAKDLMQPNVITIKHNTQLDELAKTFIDKKVGSLVVIFEEKIIGIITEQDMIALLQECAEYRLMKGLGVVDRIKNLVYEKQGHTIAKALSDIGV